MLLTISFNDHSLLSSFALSFSSSDGLIRRGELLRRQEIGPRVLRHGELLGRQEVGPRVLLRHGELLGHQDVGLYHAESASTCLLFSLLHRQRRSPAGIFRYLEGVCGL